MTASTPALRKEWRAYYETRERHACTNCDESLSVTESGPLSTCAPLLSTVSPCPPRLRGLACGAKTRKGLPCKRTGLMRSGRCKFHGGMSTGPKTAEGRAKAIANLSV